MEKICGSRHARDIHARPLLPGSLAAKSLKPRANLTFSLAHYARAFSSLAPPVSLRIMTIARVLCGTSRAAPALKCSRLLVRLFSNQPRALTTGANASPGPFSIMFFGTDSFSLPTLARLASSPTLASHIAVVCPQDAPSGRGMMQQACLVKQFALQHGLPVHLRVSFIVLPQ